MEPVMPSPRTQAREAQAHDLAGAAFRDATHQLRPVEGPLASVSYFGPHVPISERLATGLARLYATIYGDRYISPLYADPKRICAEINEGRWHAFVGFDREGEVAGQVGMMIRSDNTLELGRDVVDPSARLRGSYKQLVRSRAQIVNALIEQRDHPYEYQWAESVTGHEGSQRTYRGTLGFVPCGVGALKYPDVFDRGQRESVVLMVKIIDQGILAERPVHVPESFHELANEIFIALGCRRAAQSPGLDPSALRDLRFAVRDKRHVGQVSFDFCPQPSDNTFPMNAIDDLIAQLRDERDIHHFSVRMSLQDHRTPTLTHVLSQDGFTFGHIEPRRRGDILEVQKMVGSEPIDVKLIDDAMRRMVAHIEKTRWGGARPSA